MKKILSSLPAAFIAPLTVASIISCEKKIDDEIAKKLKYTNDKGNSTLDAKVELKEDNFIFAISGYETINSKVSGDDISDAKIKSFVEKTLKVAKKEEYKDITETFNNVTFDAKVESNKINFTNGNAKVTFKQKETELKTFKNIKIKDFAMSKADIEDLFKKVEAKDFKYDDLKAKKANDTVDFTADSKTGKALKAFAKTISKTLTVKVTKEAENNSIDLEISLQDLDAKTTITVTAS